MTERKAMPDKPMTVWRKSTFRYGDIEVTLENNVTYHGHLHLIQKAVWGLVIDELMQGRLSKEDGAHGKKPDNKKLIDIGEKALEAIVPLGYIKERMATVIEKSWLPELVFDAQLSMQFPEIYGRSRYATRSPVAAG